MDVRLATPSDLPAINDIYNHYVHHSTCTFALEPVTADERRAWFDEHDAAHPVTVAVESDGAVVGWGALNVYNPRQAYSRTVENSVYIRADRHRSGIGRLLLADLIQRAQALGHHTIIAGISDGQVASIALHESFGFTENGRVSARGWKFERWVDVLYLQKML